MRFVFYSVLISLWLGSIVPVFKFLFFCVLPKKKKKAKNKEKAYEHLLLWTIKTKLLFYID
jgi:hypothetical protein